MDKKIKFLIILFYNCNHILGTLFLFITLIFCIPIYLLPKLNYITYLFLIIILNILNYLIIRALFKEVKKYLKLLNFDFLEFDLSYYLMVNLFLFIAIIEKILNIHELSFSFLLPPQIFYSILFFIQLFIIYKEMKLSELENYDELMSKFSINLNLSHSKKYFYGLFIIFIVLYTIFIPFRDLIKTSLTFFYLLTFIIFPSITIISVTSLIEGTTYYVRKALVELKKLQDKMI